METRITKLLGIKYPVIQGGMAWVATHELASAVSNAGGLGIIGYLIPRRFVILVSMSFKPLHLCS